MLGMMYLQNAVAYDNKDLYLRAKEYLERVEEAMEEESISFETKMLVDNLRSKIETYKYRFGERAIQVSIAISICFYRMKVT